MTPETTAIVIASCAVVVGIVALVTAMRALIAADVAIARIERLERRYGQIKESAKKKPKPARDWRMI